MPRTTSDAGKTQIFATAQNARKPFSERYTNLLLSKPARNSAISCKPLVQIQIYFQKTNGAQPSYRSLKADADAVQLDWKEAYGRPVPPLRADLLFSFYEKDECPESAERQPGPRFSPM